METTKTPTSKSTRKRLAASLEGLGLIKIEGEEISATKETKMVCLKIKDLKWTKPTSLDGVIYVVPMFYSFICLCFLFCRVLYFPM